MQAVPALLPNVKSSQVSQFDPCCMGMKIWYRQCHFAGQNMSSSGTKKYGVV